jgi:hypothetical protein
MGQQSFSIQEKLFTHADRFRERWFDNITELPKRDWFANSKKIEQVFSYYGGTYATPERQYLVLTLLELSKVGSIDYLGKFESKDTVTAYSENINYYLDQAEIDQMNCLTVMYLLPGLWCNKMRLPQGSRMNPLDIKEFNGKPILRALHLLSEKLW